MAVINTPNVARTLPSTNTGLSSSVSILNPPINKMYEIATIPINCDK